MNRRGFIGTLFGGVVAAVAIRKPKGEIVTAWDLATKDESYIVTMYHPPRAVAIGTPFELDDPLKVPPQHINCRCVLREPKTWKR